MENKPKDLGAAWVKTGNYGDYISVSVEINGTKHSFTMFPNKYKKEGSNQPDYRIPAPKIQSNDSNQINKHQSNIDFVNAEKARIAKARASDPGLSHNQPATIAETDVPF